MTNKSTFPNISLNVSNYSYSANRLTAPNRINGLKFMQIREISHSTPIRRMQITYKWRRHNWQWPIMVAAAAVAAASRHPAPFRSAEPLAIWTIRYIGTRLTKASTRNRTVADTLSPATVATMPVAWIRCARVRVHRIWSDERQRISDRGRWSRSLHKSMRLAHSVTYTGPSRRLHRSTRQPMPVQRDRASTVIRQFWMT